MAKISVVVPCYNVEKYLAKCLDSLINQTFNDIQIICVNDGAVDSTPLILEEYSKKDSRIKVINKENGGLSSARNEGLKYVTSPYIAFLDSDDYFELDTLEMAYSAMVQNDVDFVCWNIFKTWEDGRKEEQKFKLKGKLKLDEKLIRKTPVMAWNKLFKTEIIKEKACLFPDGLNYEDNVFWMMYAPWAKFGYYIEKPLYNYLQRQGSIVSTSAKKFRYLPIIPVIFNYYKEQGIEKKYKKLLEQRFEYYFKADMESVFKD